MKFGFIWKRQLAYVITFVVVVMIGLGVGYLIHSAFERATVVDEAPAPALTPTPMIPSLPFPTSAPSVSAPPGNPPSGK